ncbi:peptide-methionine (S)-S-oxide reductase MsrA [Rhizobium sp. C1]|uniref:peptide-methionine (S)-S-oxide reductase MsrA n=1 Tax=Rhizobium sp. C1 TaxID=1349799 RepID=UPI001E4AA546|nr:peptide-methionine (S)-S-oxide reductase MsrA [Rhizobium sp. C1]MCD2178941.1 peptide-methionine (S)-S-oxide reductase MsrA [Rhizobium sp. C1]
MFLTDLMNKKTVMPDPARALPGRPEPIPTSETHFVNGRPLAGPYPDGMKRILLGMGCFWGAERHFWKIPGVWVTAAGYAGGFTPNPTYQETVTGLTGHAEVVLVVYDPKIVSLNALLKSFFEAHDPTQGMRQGNDVGTTYRSTIYTYDDADLKAAFAARDAFQTALKENGVRAEITTEIAPAGELYFAEDYHQQYLAKNPGGYCGLRGTGVTCAID